MEQFANILNGFGWYHHPDDHFVYFLGRGSGDANGGGRASGDFGSINGQKITQQEYVQAVNEFKLFYLFHYGTWPDKKANVSEADMERETYVRLLLIQKASDLGIHAGLDAAATVANQMLRSLARKGQTVSRERLCEPSAAAGRFDRGGFREFCPP